MLTRILLLPATLYAPYNQTNLKTSCSMPEKVKFASGAYTVRNLRFLIGLNLTFDMPLKLDPS